MHQYVGDARTHPRTMHNLLNNRLCKFFLYEFENKSIPVCFANEVWKDPIIQFEDKLPEHSRQDWLKTMEHQRALSDVMML